MKFLVRLSNRVAVGGWRLAVGKLAGRQIGFGRWPLAGWLW